MVLYTKKIPDMKYNKAKWVVPCKIASISKGGLFKLTYEVNKAFVNMNVYTLNF